MKKIVSKEKMINVFILKKSKKLNQLLAFTFFLLSACSSEPFGKRPNYYYIRYSAHLGDIYTFEITPIKDEYCSYRDRQDREHYNSKCITKNGLKIFSNPLESKNEVEIVAKEICHTEVQYIGHDSSKEFSGNSSVYCNTNKLFNSLQTNCYGGNPQFDYITKVYYKCDGNLNKSQIKNEKNNKKPSLSEKDHAFLKKMLTDKKISLEKYNEILNVENHSNHNKNNDPTQLENIENHSNQNKNNEPTQLETDEDINNIINQILYNSSK